MPHRRKTLDKSALKYSPYTNQSRYAEAKQTYIQALDKLHELIIENRPVSLVDIGCGNGDFLYYISKQHPEWTLTGFDFTKSFIDVGKRFAGLSGVRLEVLSLSEAVTLKEQFDVVTCLGTFQIFSEPEEPLNQLLSLRKDDGFVICDGLFNKYAIEVRTQFCDHSKPEGNGVWVSDYHQHSQKKLASFLSQKNLKVNFYETDMIDVPYDKDKPHVNEFTFKDSDGRNIITNGLNMIVNPTLMTIHS